ncbi:hypothetical protein ACYX7E_00620 [Luteimonas sp. RIT-PG2_3]
MKPVLPPMFPLPGVSIRSRRVAHMFSVGAMLIVAMLVALLVAGGAQAAPGAHGPNGEHLDGPAAGAAAASDGRPRMESFTELFELVAHLEHDALTAMINVYETNVPVDGAEVELESNGVVAKATFDPQTGVYRFADPKLIAMLSEPGKHPLAFTITTADDFDIVASAMDVSDAHAPSGAAPSRVWWLALTAVLLAALAFFFLRRRKPARRHAGAHA